MKFAKGLEENIVPEWRVKYIDYKGGKKKIKNVAKAIKYTQASPAVNSLYINSLLGRTTIERRPPKPKGSESNGWRQWMPSLFTATADPTTAVVKSAESAQGTTAIERSSLTGATNQLRSVQEHDPTSTTQYGTISSPPESASGVPHPPPSLQLPEPMQPLGLDSAEARTAKVRHIPGGPDISITRRKLFPFHQNKGLTSFTLANSRPALLKRVISTTRVSGAASGGKDANVDDVRDEAIEEFFQWLEAELKKIDTFYRLKEDEAARRLEELHEQLHIMRDMRLAEIRGPIKADPANSAGHDLDGEGDAQKHKKPYVWYPAGVVRNPFGSEPSPGRIKKAESLQRITTATSQHYPDLGGHLPPDFVANRNSSNAEQRGFFDQRTSGHRDYAVQRKPMNEITYRVARRKLKTAMIEYYRGLELLKSYCRQNQEGLRKITKKFDKATGLRTSKRFMTEKTTKSYFGSSDVLETLMHQAEDLFSRYFERGDRKHAVERLRTREKSHEFYGSTFRSGILLGLGVFGMIQGLVLGLEGTTIPGSADQSSYLLQIWAGFFLPLLFLLLFTLNCRTWAKNKINYVFCFEFDTRHNLDYHQLLEIPALLWFLMCLIFWLNFENFWPDTIHPTQYPIIFLALCLGVVFAPLPILYHKSRRWFLYANWRLLLSGLYPVEFRDFWLGDMYCSLTYTMGNIALFSCLYNGHWDTPGKCNSSHSRLLGFFSCLPGIWRLLQCLRRYRDTQNAFPHLANAGKYACTVLYYVSLSLWRIDKTEGSKALFIAFGTVNSVYCSTWDLAMDWSLLNPYAAWPFLRQEMGFKRPMLYYLAMIVDPILRFNWIFYIIFARDIQHSTIVSFLISLSEIFRRWMWAFFRMENEHCTNVGNFRAYREVPLPYELPPQTPKFALSSGNVDVVSSATPGASGTSSLQATAAPPPVTSRNRSHSSATLAGYQQQPAPTTIEEHPDLERQHTSTSSLRYRPRGSATFQRRGTDGGTPAMRALNAMGSALARAHTQDFERRKNRTEAGITHSDEEDEDDDESSHLSDDDSQTAENPSTAHRRNATVTSIIPSGSTPS